MFKGISKKQAGVIYGNYKRGNVEATAEVMNHVYDYADFCTSNATQRDRDMVNALRACVDAIFAGDMDEAQAKLDRFEHLHKLTYAA